MLRADLARKPNFSLLVRRCACPALLGQVRHERVDVKVRNGLEVTVKEQQGWVKHETGESEMERCDTCAKNFIDRHLSPCVYVHTHEDVWMCNRQMCNRKMCVQQVSVCTLHTVVAPAWERNHKKHCRENSVKKRKINIHHSMTVLKKFSIRRLGSEPLFNSQTSSFRVHLDLSYWYLFHPLAFHHCEWRLLGFPRRASLRHRPS